VGAKWGTGTPRDGAKIQVQSFGGTRQPKQNAKYQLRVWNKSAPERKKYMGPHRKIVGEKQAAK